MSAENTVTIIPFDSKYAADFASLNYQWIERYFVVEEHDREILDHPMETIITPGGEVFFAISDGEAVGTCAMVRTNESMYELTKMAVAPASQGKGIANLLMRACIELARDKGAGRIFLETNSKLPTAISLYRKFGFVDTPLDPESQYSRANVRMELAI